MAKKSSLSPSSPLWPVVGFDLVCRIITGRGPLSVYSLLELHNWSNSLPSFIGQAGRQAAQQSLPRKSGDRATA